jgi:hypothetical protein
MAFSASRAVLARKFFVGGNWKCNGLSKDVKTLMGVLNAGARRRRR